MKSQNAKSGSIPKTQRLGNDTRAAEHLKKRQLIAKTLGLEALPDITTIGRLWSRYMCLLEGAFVKIVEIFQLAVPTKIVVDSPPLVDLYDMEVAWGYTSRGKF